MAALRRLVTSLVCRWAVLEHLKLRWCSSKLIECEKIKQSFNFFHCGLLLSDAWGNDCPAASEKRKNVRSCHKTIMVEEMTNSKSGKFVS